MTQTVITTDDRSSALSSMIIAASASIGAGAIHATAIGSHVEHSQVVVVFAIVTIFQIGWGAAALSRPTNRMLAMVGGLGNGLLLAGWVLAKSRGISFIDGLDEKEPVQLADGLCAGLAGLSVIFVAHSLADWRLPGRGRIMAAVMVAATGVVVYPGMVNAAHHHHHDDTATAATGDGHAHSHTAEVSPHPFDPNLPIDLGGVDGVTPAEQARAENLVAINLLRLPHYKSTDTAKADGFSSIGDGLSGFEHYVNWAYLDDGRILDPDHPESLVYRVGTDGSRTLVSAMYMLPPGSTLDTVPNVGGPLTQWHIHDNLCFLDVPGLKRVAGVTRADGTCPSPLVKLQPLPMIHVWITSHPCGPFASLEGVGAGQIKPGETRLCDTAHGSH